MNGTITQIIGPVIDARFSAEGGSASGGEGYMTHYVYVLRSVKNQKRYVGSTTFSPEERCAQHNAGANQWTKGNGPFILIYQENYATSTEARKRENFLKSGVGRTFLKEFLERAGGGMVDAHV